MLVDEPTPCFDRPWAYDTLIDDYLTIRKTPHYIRAWHEAQGMCARCPLAAKAACREEHQDELWVAALKRDPIHHGTPRGYKQHLAAGIPVRTGDPCGCNKAWAAYQQRRQNMQGIAAKNAEKTHCVNDHPLEGDNLHVAPSGARICVTCRRAKDARRYQKRKNSAA